MRIRPRDLYILDEFRDRGNTDLILNSIMVSLRYSLLSTDASIVTPSAAIC